MAQINEEGTYTWIIENYSFFNNKYGVNIRSPDFSINGIVGNMYIFPRGEEDNRNVHVSILRFFDMHTSNLKSSGNFVDELKSFDIELCTADNELLVSSEMTKKIEYPSQSQYNFLDLASPEELEKKLKNSSKDDLIVRCRMTLSEGKLSKSSFVAKTVICFDEYSFMHSIEALYDESVSDNPFRIILGGSEFDITLKNPRDDILLEIRHLKGGDIQRFKCKVYWFDFKGEEMYSCCDRYQFDKLICWSFPNFFQRTSNGKKFLKVMPFESSSSIKYSFSVPNGSTITESVDGTILDDPSSLEKTNPGYSVRIIPDFIKAMFLNEKGADVKFQIDEEVMNAHKKILLRNAPEFAKEMIVKKEQIINISDMNAKTFKSFLKFIYTDYFDDIDSENALELLSAGEKYHMNELKNRAAHFLSSRLSHDIVLDVVAEADRVKEQFLKMTAINYIKRNISEISCSRKWLKWIQNNAKLCSEIVCSFSKDIKNTQKKI